MINSSWKYTILTASGVGVALLPKLICLMCWPAYAGIVSSVGTRRPHRDQVTPPHDRRMSGGQRRSGVEHASDAGTGRGGSACSRPSSCSSGNVSSNQPRPATPASHFLSSRPFGMPGRGERSLMPVH